MRIKGWKKEKDESNYVSYRTTLEKDYNLGQPKHMQVKDNIFSVEAISAMRQWHAKDIPERDIKKSVWVIRIMSKSISKIVKTKQQALDFMVSYMKKHPRG